MAEIFSDAENKLVSSISLHGPTRHRQIQYSMDIGLSFAGLSAFLRIQGPSAEAKGSCFLIRTFTPHGTL